MAYAFIQDVPGNAAIYQEIKRELGDEAPPGLIALVVTARPGGLRHLHVWDDQQAWERYRAEKVGPAAAAVLARLGIEPRSDDVHVEPVDLIDFAVGPALTIAAPS
jgi:hypothetical protein